MMQTSQYNEFVCCCSFVVVRLLYNERFHTRPFLYVLRAEILLISAWPVLGRDIDTEAQRLDTFDPDTFDPDTMELRYLLNQFDTVNSC